MKLLAIKNLIKRFHQMEGSITSMQLALGRIETRQLQDFSAANIHGAEFKVFSQWGEDGILQHLIRHVPISRKIFVEFGIENYTEANTRFLILKDNWAGLVIDGDLNNIKSIKRDAIYWRHNLKAECTFITRDNINQIILSNGISGEIGILSIDIDGNDYWVWEAIDVVLPSIVVIEYNSRFGSERAVTVPYDANFRRTKAHYSNIYYGVSLAALCLLGKKKGYSFVGCNTAGNNAFFVRAELRPADLPELTSSIGFVQAQFRESIDAQGALTFLNQNEEAAILEKLPIVDVSQN